MEINDLDVEQWGFTNYPNVEGQDCVTELIDKLHGSTPPKLAAFHTLDEVRNFVKGEPVLNKLNVITKSRDQGGNPSGLGLPDRGAVRRRQRREEEEPALVRRTDESRGRAAVHMAALHPAAVGVDH